MMDPDQARVVPAPTTRRRLWLSGIGGAAASLLVVAGLLYGFFWEPFREPASDVPRIVELLPATAETTVPKEELNEYAWVDRASGVVRIPIAEAMKIIAAQGGDEHDMPEQSISTDAGSGRDVKRQSRGEER